MGKLKGFQKFKTQLRDTRFLLQRAESMDEETHIKDRRALVKALRAMANRLETTADKKGISVDPMYKNNSSKE